MDSGSRSDFEIRQLSADRIASIQDRTEYSDDSPVRLSRIVAVRFLHFDFSGDVRQGEIHILEVMADGLLRLMTELHRRKFPIQAAIPIDEFDGDDVASMEANNTSGFNPRRVMNTDRWSSHAYGAAIDINPLQNPYVPNPEVTPIKVYPSLGAPYLNREDSRPGMVDTIADLAADCGFDDWGGSWASPLDYHHFQVRWERILKITKKPLLGI